ncbi:hypothetical protein ACGFYE_39700 [Streptomyces zaomyceticus]|uniref:hypothetical protein n=1 Tax=Streptomyces zaomyceticus TaxID=68286 RepID=UPI00371929C5
MFSHDAFAISTAQVQEILARLRPHLPANLKKIEPNPKGFGMRYEFGPFTGTEPCPEGPAAFRRDPGLTFVRESEDVAEHQLRTAADRILTDLYDTARKQWTDAVYVRDLKAVVQDAPALWAAYQREATVLETAYAYLRTPEAAGEWPSAVARLVDAQDSTAAAAAAFDRRAADIARVHDRHLYADLGRSDAFARAGHPQAADWHIVSYVNYASRSYSEHDAFLPLAAKVRHLIERQEAHLAKVARLAPAALTAPTVVAQVPNPRQHG